jgi:hypothetical protein
MGDYPDLRGENGMTLDDEARHASLERVANGVNVQRPLREEAKNQIEALQSKYPGAAADSVVSRAAKGAAQPKKRSFMDKVDDFIASPRWDFTDKFVDNPITRGAEKVLGYERPPALPSKAGTFEPVGDRGVQMKVRPDSVIVGALSHADFLKNMGESGFANGVPNTGVMLPTAGAGRSGTTTTSVAAARKLVPPEQFRALVNAEIQRRGGATSPEVTMAATEQVARDLASNGTPESAALNRQLQPERIGAGGYNVAADSIPGAVRRVVGNSNVPAMLNLRGKPEPIPAAAAMKADPAAVRARVDKAWEATREPVPTDRPTPAGIIVDRSNLQPVEGVSGVLPSRTSFTDRMRSGHMAGISNDEQHALMKAQTERGERMMPSTFYPSAQRFLNSIGDHGGNVPLWHAATNAAAIQNGVPGELVGGSTLYWGLQQGIIDPEELAAANSKDAMKALVAKVRGAHKAYYPGANGLQLYAGHGTSLRSQLSGVQSPNYKIPQYGLQKAEPDAAGFVLDTHGAKSSTVTSPFGPYFSEEGGFAPAEYGHMEHSIWRPVAHDMGLSDSRMQEAQWRGAGNFTGLRTPPNQDYGQIAEDLVLNHARLRNLSPQDAMRRIATGQEPLFQLPKNSQPSMFDY